MKVYGSKTSPFVRRIRLLLENKPYEFVEVNIFDKEQRKEIAQKSPTIKIPFLDDGGQIVWDSRVIFSYLCEKGYHSKITPDEENLLTLLDDLSDTLIQLLLARRSQITFPENSPLGISHKERIGNIFPYLDAKVKEGCFKDWSYPSMCLYASLDWVLFREMCDYSSYSSLVEFHKNHQNKPICRATDPRG